MSAQKIAFIGGGNMTLAIARGLLDSQTNFDSIAIAEPGAAQREKLKTRLPGVNVFTANRDAAANAGLWIMAVKPQVLKAVCDDLKSLALESRPLVVSIAAGIRSDNIDSWLGGGLPVVRVMPNQPALLGQGVSGLYANSAATADHLEAAKTVMQAIGEIVIVPDESDIDTVTAVSGSGPAYFYLLIDILASEARRLGISDNAARLLAVQTAAGAAEIARQSDDSMDELIRRVRSPGGTTAAALDSLEDAGIRDTFAAAIHAARQRAVDLADAAD